MPHRSPRHPLGDDLRQSAERHRHGALAHLAVSAGRGVASNVHHARRRRPQLDGPERAVVHRPARVQGGLDGHEHARPGHRERRVHHPRDLGVRAREVGHDAVAVDGQLDPHEHRVEPALFVVLEVVLVATAPVRELRDPLPQPPLRAVEVDADHGVDRTVP